MDINELKSDAVLTGVVISGIVLNSLSPIIDRTAECLLWDDGSVILWDNGSYMSKDK